MSVGRLVRRVRRLSVGEFPDEGVAAAFGSLESDVGLESLRPLRTRTGVREIFIGLQLLPGEAAGAFLQGAQDCSSEFGVAHGDRDSWLGS